MPNVEDPGPKARWLGLTQCALIAGLLIFPFWKLPWHHWAAIACVGGFAFLQNIHDRPRGPRWCHIIPSLLGGLLLLKLAWYGAGEDRVRYFRVWELLDDDAEALGAYVLAAAGALVAYGALGLLWRAGYALLREVRWWRRRG